MRSLPALLLLTLPAFAADVNMKPVYLQSVPHAQVVIDRKGKAWFADQEGVRDATNKVICKEPQGKLILVDTAGRCWFADNSGYRKPLRYFDGKGWTDTGVVGQEVYEDAAGRILVRTAAGFAVFDGKTWAESKVFDTPVEGSSGKWVVDAAGRVWHHLYRVSAVRPKVDGVWAFDGKGWKHYDPPDREQGEYVEHLLPFADDWFLVLVKSDEEGAANSHWPRAFAWSPSRTAAEIAKAKPFEGLPTDQLEFRGTDRDGVRYFRWLADDGPIWQKAPDYPPGYAVDPKGKVRQLTREEGERISRQPYQWYSGPRLIHAALGDATPAVPCELGRSVGTDADGRVYLRASIPVHAATRTWVLWPKQEKPGECVRPVRYPVTAGDPWARPAAFSGPFTDSSGIAFARPRDRFDSVVVWDGKATKWAETPIKALPLAHWYARPAPPPEYGLANLRAIGHVCGTDGLTLFVRVKTKYAPEKEGEGFNVRGDPLPKVKEDAPLYIYEAWLHAGGKWSESTPPADLIKVKRKELLASLAVPATPLGPLPVISHADRLWFAHDWKVFAIDADGVTRSADIPKPEAKAVGPRDKPTTPLMLASFARRDDKTLVLVVRGIEKTYTVRFQAGKLEGVQVEELGPLPLLSPTLHVAPDGTVLAWGEGGPGVQRLTTGKWEPVPDAGRVLAVGGDGAAWCDAFDRASDADLIKGSMVLVRVAGANAERFVWTPDELEVGFQKPAEGVALLWLPDAGLGCIESGKPGVKPTLRVRHAPPLTSASWPTPAAVTASGHLLLPNEWAVLFDSKAPK